MKGSKAGMKQVFSSHVSALIFHTRRQVSSRFHLSPLKKACDSLATSFSAQRELGLCWRGNFKFHCQGSSPHPFHVLSMSSLHQHRVNADPCSERQGAWAGKDRWERSVIFALLLGNAKKCAHWGAPPLLLRGGLWGSRTEQQKSPTTAIPGRLVTGFPGNGIKS